MLFLINLIFHISELELIIVAIYLHVIESEIIDWFTIIFGVIEQGNSWDGNMFWSFAYWFLSWRLNWLCIWFKLIGISCWYFNKRKWIWKCFFSLTLCISWKKNYLISHCLALTLLYKKILYFMSIHTKNSFSWVFHFSLSWL